jgi:hypothetical protein
MRLGRKLATGIVTESVPEPIPATDELDGAARPADVRVEDAPEQPVELIEQSAGR